MMNMDNEDALNKVATTNRKLDLVNPQTGEVINLATSSAEDISNYLLRMDEIIKQAEQHKKAAIKYIEQNRLDGDRFGDWTVTTANRSSIKFEPDTLPAEDRDKWLIANHTIEELKKKYGVEVLTQFKQWRRPKF